MIRILPFFSFLAILCTLGISCKTGNGGAPQWKHNDNTLRVQQPTTVRTLNPYLYRTGYDAQVFKYIFQGMMEIDPSSFEMTPVLIKSQPLIEDIKSGEYAGGQKYTFEILDEATWDDGQPVTGYDFLFSMKAIFNPHLPTRRIYGYFENVREVVVDDDHPKKFSVFTNNAYLLSKPGISNFILLPQHVYDPDGLLSGVSFKSMRDPKTALTKKEEENLKAFAEAFSNPKYGHKVISGCGPYNVAEWEEGQRVVLVKKQNWWGEKLAGKNVHLTAYPDTIIFYPIADQTATVTALKDENIDLASSLDARQFVDLRENEFVRPIFDFYTPPTFAYYMAIFNNRNPKLSDKRVRRALAHLVDVDLIIKELMNGLAERMVGPVFPDKKYFDKSLAPIPFDPDRARQLLRQAGWEDTDGNGIVDKVIDGRKTELKLSFQYVPTSNFQDNFSRLFKNNAQKAGIEIERVPLEFKVIRENCSNGNFEMTTRASQWLPLPDDFKQLWHTNSIGPGGSNYTRFGNAETDALIEAIRYNSNEEERNQLYLQFQRIIYDEQPAIFLLSPLDRIVVHKRFDPLISRMGPSLQHFKLKKNNL